MILYDNDAYREEFMGIVYGILSSDITNDRANQIIDAFDSAPQVEIDERSSTDPLTLEELREMDGEPVWITSVDRSTYTWMLVDVKYEVCREAHGGLAVFENLGKTWLAYRRKPEGPTR